MIRPIFPKLIHYKNETHSFIFIENVKYHNIIMNLYLTFLNNFSTISVLYISVLYCDFLYKLNNTILMIIF